MHEGRRLPDSAGAHSKAEHERLLRAMEEFIAAYEAEHGVITDEEMDEVARRFRAKAIVVRPSRAPE